METETVCTECLRIAREEIRLGRSDVTIHRETRKPKPPPQWCRGFEFAAGCAAQELADAETATSIATIRVIYSIDD